MRSKDNHRPLMSPCRVAILAAAMLGACAAPEVMDLPTWTVSSAGARDAAITAPERLPVDQHAGTYRLSTHVDIPAAWRDEDLELTVPLQARARLWVDGAETLEIDPPVVYRTSLPHRWLVPKSDSPRRELVLEVEHSWTQATWLLTTPRLARASAPDPWAAAVAFFNFTVTLAAFAALLQLGLTSLGVFLVDRRRVSYLWFGAQTMAASYYPLFVSGYGARIFGVYDVAVLGIMNQLAVTASIQFTHSYFELRRPSRWWWYVCAAFSVVTVVASDPFWATHITGTFTVGYITVVVVYQIWTCAGLVRRHRDRIGAMFLLGGWVTVAAMTTPDFVYWLHGPDLLGGIRLGSVGLGVFAGWLSMLLGRRHITSLMRADDLNTELAGRVVQLETRGAEIEQLNSELRRQIAERSQQIFAALMLAGQKSTRLADPRPGDLVQGRYRIERPIGAGGMGTVYAVTRLTDARQFALKMARELDHIALARLAHEAQIAATISHPNLVTIVDVDISSTGFLYIVMELVEGTSLKEHRASYGNVAWVLPVLRQVAEGLAALHAASIVHRDLKPANILVTHTVANDLRIKIADFGISSMTARGDAPFPLDGRTVKTQMPATGDSSSAAALADGRTVQLPTTGSSGVAAALLDGQTVQLPATGSGSTSTPASMSSLTAPGVIAGTPAYIAPEVVGGRQNVSPAADMFAFGILAYELLTAKPPFHEPPAIALMHSRKAPVATPIERAKPGLDPAVAALVDRCLSYDARDRPTAAHTARVLADLLDELRKAG